MVSRSQKIRLGIFLTTAIIILVVAIGIITGSRLLKKQAVYYIRFKDVSLTGLEVGSSVKYRGIRIGRVDNIYIDPDDIASVIVKMNLNPKVPIKENTEAILTFIGITGLKMIELRGGTNEAKDLPPESFIKPGQSVVETITGRAEIIAEKLELILNNLANFTAAGNREKFLGLIENTSRALNNFATLLDTNQTHLNNIIANFDDISGNLDTLIVSANFAVNDIRKITQSNELVNTVGNLEKVSGQLAEADLRKVIKKMEDALEQTNRTFTHLDLTLLKSRHDILSSTEILRESLEYFNEFTRLISENPSLLLRSSPQKEIRER
ncbi:MAG: MCE family protein [Calditrichaeota bacterium]|nr:MCE family protein [Calditrichota bacterium]